MITNRWYFKLFLKLYNIISPQDERITNKRNGRIGHLYSARVLVVYQNECRYCLFIKDVTDLF